MIPSSTVMCANAWSNQAEFRCLLRVKHSPTKPKDGACRSLPSNCCTPIRDGESRRFCLLDCDLFWTDGPVSSAVAHRRGGVAADFTRGCRTEPLRTGKSAKGWRSWRKKKKRKERRPEIPQSCHREPSETVDKNLLQVNLGFGRALRGLWHYATDHSHDDRAIQRDLLPSRHDLPGKNNPHR